MAEDINNGGGGAAVKSKRDMMEERMRSRYADKKFENDDEMYGAAMDEWDGMESKIKAADEENAKAMEALQKSPAAMMFLSAILNGGAEAEALADLKDYFEFSDEEKAAHNEKLRKNMESEEAAKKAAETYQENLAKTADALGKWAEENGLSIEEACGMIDEFCNRFVNKFNSGAMDKDFFEAMFRMMNYDKDMAAAREAGRKEGINEGIKSKAERKEGDGLPKVSGGGMAAGQMEKPKPQNMLERLREANNQRGVLG